MVASGDRGTGGGRVVWSILIGIVLVVIVHYVALTVVFTAASHWDSACDHLYREQMGERPKPSSSRGSGHSFYADPGYSCEYWVDGEWLMLRKDLSGARNTVLGITAVTVVVVGVGVAVYNRKRS